MKGGTYVIMVETFAGLKMGVIHQRAVDEVVAKELRGGGLVVSATTTTTIVGEFKVTINDWEVLRNTTIVFCPV